MKSPVRPPAAVLLLLASLGGCGLLGQHDAAGAAAGSTGNGATERKSIRNWVRCDGVADDADGVARAFDVAKHNAFTLVVDCPVRLQIGIDVAKTIFIDDGTTVEFTGEGKFTVDNVFHPAFVIANSRHIRLVNWNVEYDASLPVNWDVGGYKKSGQFVERKGYAQPASAFNDFAITPWLRANRGVNFEAASSFWAGPTNISSVFFFVGDTSDVRVTGMHLHVPPNAGADRFIPMAFSFTANYKDHQRVTRATPMTGGYIAIPHDLTFSDVDLDGTYMGWQGNVGDAVFRHIRSHRYGDLQDAQGGNVGGIGKWFAPPHLFYLSYAPAGDPLLFNRNIQISDVVDDGPRVGVARDKQGDKLSGYALSLKLGCHDCSVDGYKTTRPDGFLDLLPSDNLTISNVDATYDSAFINDLFPGWRFPSTGYRNVKFENVSLNDSAATSVQAPIADCRQASNANIVFSNVRVVLRRWSSAGLPLPAIEGQGNDITLAYFLRDSGTRIAQSNKDGIQVTLQTTPTAVNGAAASAVTWSSKGAGNCGASGAWSGPVTTEGSRTVQTPASADQALTLECQSATGTASVTLHMGTAG